MTYRMGPGPAKVHLKLAFNWDLKPVYDVIATMRGAEEPDVWVLRGNHHDAWVNGAEDPISGQVALLEEARALANLPNRDGSRSAPSCTSPGMVKSPCCSVPPSG